MSRSNNVKAVASRSVFGTSRQSRKGEVKSCVSPDLVRTR